MTSEVNLPDVVDEVRAVFASYERALVVNDLDTLEDLFWDSTEVVRFGPEGRQQGWQQVAALRRSLPAQTPPRTLRATVVTTFGRDVAVVTTEFVPDGIAEVGGQSQTWVRRPEG